MEQQDMEYSLMTKDLSGKNNQPKEQLRIYEPQDITQIC